jgi:sigma-B regulation protein RsbU (phosphoserine phosphatase)
MDRLLAADTAQHLIGILEDELPRIGAAPALLRLYDASADVYYPAAGFGRDVHVADLPRSAVLPEQSLELSSNGQPVGLLEISSHSDRRLESLAALLGPLLLQLHRRQLVVEELRETREIVAHLAVAGDLVRHLDLEVLLTKILETALGATGAQVGAIQLPGVDGKLISKVSWGLQEEHLTAMRLTDGRLVTEAVFTTGTQVFAERRDVKRVLDLSTLQAQLDGILVLALPARDRILGVIVLANPTHDFGAAKRRLAETLCNLAGTAIDNALLVKDAIERERLRQEIDIARTVQEKMFPTSGLNIGSLLAEGWSRPCNETGGDYYTFLPRGGGSGGMVTMIGDVSGHGLGAALFTTMAHAIAQQQFRAATDLKTAFQQVNEGLFHTRSGRFMTAAAVAINSKDGSFTYVSAGHNPLLWINQGKVRWLESTTMPFGIGPSLEIDPSPNLVMEPGDLLVLYTDGITEAAHQDGTTLGEERLADTVLAAWRSRLSPQQVLSLIATAVDGFTAGQTQEDDLTAVVVARDGGGGLGGWQLGGNS